MGIVPYAVVLSDTDQHCPVLPYKRPAPRLGFGACRCPAERLVSHGNYRVGCNRIEKLPRRAEVDGTSTFPEHHIAAVRPPFSCRDREHDARYRMPRCPGSRAASGTGRFSG